MKKLILIFTFLLISLALLGLNVSATPLTTCGTITVSDSYTLSNNLISPDGLTCLDINANDVDLNLNGKTISNSTEDGFSAVNIWNSNNVTIHNGIITASSNMINASLSSNVSIQFVTLNTTESVDTTVNGFGIQAVGVNKLYIGNVNVINTSLYLVRLAGNTHEVIVNASLFDTENGFYNSFVFEQDTGNATIFNNDFTGTGSYAIASGTLSSARKVANVVVNTNRFNYVRGAFSLDRNSQYWNFTNNNVTNANFPIILNIVANHTLVQGNYIYNTSEVAIGQSNTLPTYFNEYSYNYFKDITYGAISPKANFRNFTIAHNNFTNVNPINFNLNGNFALELGDGSGGYRDGSIVNNTFYNVFGMVKVYGGSRVNISFNKGDLNNLTVNQEAPIWLIDGVNNAVVYNQIMQTNNGFINIDSNSRETNATLVANNILTFGLSNGININSNTPPKSSNDIIIKDNLISTIGLNGGEGYMGIYARNVTRITIINNTINSADNGIYLESASPGGGSNNNISQNLIYNNNNLGIRIVNSSGLDIYQNQIHDVHTAGIYLDGAGILNIVNNTIHDIFQGQDGRLDLIHSLDGNRLYLKDNNLTGLTGATQGLGYNVSKASLIVGNRHCTDAYMLDLQANQIVPITTQGTTFNSDFLNGTSNELVACVDLSPAGLDDNITLYASASLGLNSCDDITNAFGVSCYAFLNAPLVANGYGTSYTYNASAIANPINGTSVSWTTATGYDSQAYANSLGNISIPNYQMYFNNACNITLINNVIISAIQDTNHGGTYDQDQCNPTLDYENDVTDQGILWTNLTSLNIGDSLYAPYSYYSEYNLVGLRQSPAYAVLNDSQRSPIQWIMHGLPYPSTPQLLKFGKVCNAPDCVITGYSAGDLGAEVLSMGNFTTADLINLTFVPPTTSPGTTFNTTLLINLTASDSNTGVKNFTLFLYNSTSLVNTTTSLGPAIFLQLNNASFDTYSFYGTGFSNNNDSVSTDRVNVTISNPSPSPPGNGFDNTTRIILNLIILLLVIAAVAFALVFIPLLGTEEGQKKFLGYAIALLIAVTLIIVLVSVIAGML